MKFSKQYQQIIEGKTEFKSDKRILTKSEFKKVLKQIGEDLPIYIEEYMSAVRQKVDTPSSIVYTNGLDVFIVSLNEKNAISFPEGGKIIKKDKPKDAIRSSELIDILEHGDPNALVYIKTRFKSKTINQISKVTGLGENRIVIS